jgi:hypothetical protein
MLVKNRYKPCTDLVRNVSRLPLFNKYIHNGKAGKTR